MSTRIGKRLSIANVKPPFSPLWLRDLSGWWSMKHAADRSVTAGRVTQLNDKSGLGRHFTEVGGKGPTEQLTGWNGKPSMLFNGVDQYLVADAVTADFSGIDMPMTIFAAAEWTFAANDRLLELDRSSTTATAMAVVTGGSNINVYRRDDAAVLVSALGSATPSGRRIYSVVFPGTTVSTYIDGAVDINAGAFDVGATTQDLFSLACARPKGVPTQYANVCVAELCIYKRALSTAEQRDVRNYLIANWGVS